MNQLEGWTDIVGKDITITEHSYNTGSVRIAGIIKEICIGNFSRNDEYFSTRPIVFFYADPKKNSNLYNYMLVKLNKLSSESMQTVKETAETIMPDQAIYFNTLKDKMTSNYLTTLNTRNSIIVGSIVTLIIAVLGLIGYIVDEIKRRGKEIAIRRINGAQLSEIRGMFLRKMVLTAVPSVVAGCILAAITSLRWEQQFTIQAGLPWWCIALTMAATLLIVVIITEINVMKLSSSNPVESFKTE